MAESQRLEAPIVVFVWTVVLSFARLVFGIVEEQMETKFVCEIC